LRTALEIKNWPVAEELANRMATHPSPEISSQAVLLRDVIVARDEVNANA